MKIKYDEVITILDENNNIMFHTDGNTLYDNKYVQFEYKTISKQHPNINFITSNVYNLAELISYNIPLKETMRSFKKRNWNLIEFYNPNTNTIIYINKNNLCKNTQLFTKNNLNDKSMLCVKNRKNVVIGVIMPQLVIITNENELKNYKTPVCIK